MGRSKHSGPDRQPDQPVQVAMGDKPKDSKGYTKKSGNARAKKVCEAGGGTYNPDTGECKGGVL